MAELSTHHVVDQSQSVGDLSPSDAPAITSNTTSAFTGEVDGIAELAQTENGIHNTNLVKMDDLDDVSARSDTDTSRADGSVSEDKPVESKPVKKFSTSKPLSFAKYSVPKVVAANAATKGIEKGKPQPLAHVMIDVSNIFHSTYSEFIYIFLTANRSSEIGGKEHKLSAAES